MGDRPEPGLSVARIDRPARLALWAILVLLLVSTLGTAGGTAGRVAAPSPALHVAGSCAGAPVASSYSGGLSVEGGPLSSSAAVGVSIRYNYTLEVAVASHTTGQILSTACDPAEGNTSTGPTGSFSFTLAVPADHCYGSLCTLTTGPYGPLTFGPANAPPPGYESVSRTNGTLIALTFVAELGGITLLPSNASRTVSPDAPTSFTTVATAADGTPSPLTPTFHWNLTGAGWSFQGSPSGANATVEAAPGAALGELSVRASAVVGPNRFSVGPRVVSLESATTEFTGASANRTTLDAGGSVAFSVTGTGAPGYTYTAEVAPGLGVAPVAWACTTSANSGVAVTVDCAGSLTYPASGFAQPTLELTNGYSAAAGTLPSVTVASLPLVYIAPVAPVGYVGAPLPIRVTISSGTGTAPYLLACLETGSGSRLCSSSAGPSWAFAPVYPAPGNYSALAWVVDGDGTNRSVSFAVSVVPPLAVSPVDLSSSPITAAAPTDLASVLAGGDLPLRYWWNVSGSPGSIATGLRSVDGPLSVAWVPSQPGSVIVSLTVADGAGTVVETSALTTVGPALANRLAEVEIPGAEPVVAGTPVVLVWQAEDVHGGAVVGFAAAGEIRVDDAAGRPLGSAWVNASGVGPLPGGGPGLFQVPATAWNLGRLSLTVATVRAGPVDVRLLGPGLLNQTAALGLAVVADLGHLHLFHPTVVLGGARTNRTFWRVADRFANPAEGAAVDILYSSDGTSSESVVAVIGAGPGATGVWVNFSAPTDAGGSLEVSDPAGSVLLGPIAVPPAPSAAPALTAPILTLATALPLGALGLGLTAWVRRRRRGSPRTGGATDEELRHLVEGRERVITLVRDGRALDLDGLEASWLPGSVPPELPEWVASLVADGTLGARTGPDGVARFCLVAPPAGPPLVLTDPRALDRADAARRALTREAEDDGFVPGSTR